jgi:ribosomal protein S27E
MALRSRMDSILYVANEAHRRIDSFDSQIGGLGERVEQLRRSDYRFMPDLEEQVEGVTSRWRVSAPGYRSQSQVEFDRITREAQSLNMQLSSAGGVSTAEALLNTLNLVATQYGDSVNSMIGGYQGELEGIERDLGVAESTMALLVEHSFQWKHGESPVISVRAQHLDKGVPGILTLTNMRFIYEEERVEVLKKVLFFATEKKLVREVLIDQPIGAVESLRSGSMGLFKGAGLYIKFKEGTGGGEVRFDTKGKQGDQISRFYQYVMGGGADEVMEDGDEDEKEVFRPVVCPHCSAPYTEEVYRGQTSVECRYCGTVVRL